MTLSISPTKRLDDLHTHHLAYLRSLPARIDEIGLALGTTYTMYWCEMPLMNLHAREVLTGLSVPTVVEVGLGLGVFATALKRYQLGAYYAIEPHEGVVRLVWPELKATLLGAQTVITEPWQVVDIEPASVDVIMLDTWPPEGFADSDFLEFVHLFAEPALRPGGRFTFFNSGSQLTSTRRKALDSVFPSWTARKFSLAPASLPIEWVKATGDFLVPVATKQAL